MYFEPVRSFGYPKLVDCTPADYGNMQSERFPRQGYRCQPNFNQMGVPFMNKQPISKMMQKPVNFAKPSKVFAAPQMTSIKKGVQTFPRF